MASKLERPEEEKVVHVAERNSFHPFDFRVGGSRFRVVRESFRGDVPEQRRKSEEGTFEPAQWPRFIFSSPFRVRCVGCVDTLVLLGKPGLKFRVESV